MYLTKKLCNEPQNFFQIRLQNPERNSTDNTPTISSFALGAKVSRPTLGISLLDNWIVGSHDGAPVDCIYECD